MADDAADNLAKAAEARQAKRPIEAQRHYQAALQHQPDQLPALLGLGSLLMELGRYDEAAGIFQDGLQRHPGSEALLRGVLAAHLRLKHFAQAAQAAQRFLETSPASAYAWSSLADTLVARQDMELFDAAEAAAARAVELAPANAAYAVNLGRLKLLRRDVPAAAELFERATRLDPQHVVAHGMLGMTLLAGGDYPRGWAEWSWHYEHAAPPPPAGQAPLWDGGELQGRTILVYAEQGQGDTIQFIRFARLLAQRGAEVVAQCQPALKRLLVACDFLAAVRETGEPLPPHDCRTPVSFLPHRLGTTLATIPADVPYLKADPRATEAWRRQLAQLGPGMKVGLVWRGSPGFLTDKIRSVALQTLMPLAQVAGVKLLSLQKGAGGEEAAACGITDWTARLKDFADTAALVAGLDLVISVDTAVAHLAGALGKNVWIMLPYAPDWRWMLEHEDTPWYPMARLFRQPKPGDWPAVVEAMAVRLAAGG